MAVDITHHELASVEGLVSQVNADVWAEVQFSPHVYYSDYVRQPEYSSKDKPLGNCNLFAAKAAEAIVKGYGEDYLAYIGHCNSHCFALAVSDMDVHFINADAPKLSVISLDRAGPDGSPIFFDDDTIAQLRQGDNFIYSKNARPQEMMVDAYSLLSQAWADSSATTVGFVKWPLANKYLIMHSQVRKILKEANGAFVFPAQNIDTAIATYRQLRPYDLAVSDSPRSYETKTYVNHLGDEVKAPGRNVVIGTAIARFASLATSAAELAQCGDLADALYQETGPDFVVSIQSPAHRLETSRTYHGLAERAHSLGLTALATRFEGVATLATAAIF